MSNLEKLLKEKYNISETESIEASQSLIDLFKILHKIDTRLQKQSTQEIPQIKTKINKETNEYHGNSN
jgi:hypothetical protein